MTAVVLIHIRCMCRHLCSKACWRVRRCSPVWNCITNTHGAGIHEVYLPWWHIARTKNYALGETDVLSYSVLLYSGSVYICNAKVCAKSCSNRACKICAKSCSNRACKICAKSCSNRASIHQWTNTRNSIYNLTPLYMHACLCCDACRCWNMRSRGFVRGRVVAWMLFHTLPCSSDLVMVV